MGKPNHPITASLSLKDPSGSMLQEVIIIYYITPQRISSCEQRPGSFWVKRM